MDPKAPFTPGKRARLEFDLHGERAKVALLAVDKAFYALKADNKLTAKQVILSHTYFLSQETEVIFFSTYCIYYNVISKFLLIFTF